MNWGGSGIEKVVFDWILENVPIGSTVVELGAGHVSTQALAQFYKTYSVEENRDFIGHYPVAYIMTPIVNEWYDIEVLKKYLPEKKEQKLILIDGNYRSNFIHHIELFNPEAIYLVHDSDRDSMIRLVNDISVKLNRPATFHTNGDYWATI